MPYLGQLLRTVPQKTRVHVAPRLAALHHLAEAVQVELPLEAAELVVCRNMQHEKTRGRAEPKYRLTPNNQ